MRNILQEGITLYMKKFASLMCALALIVSCFSLTAFAAEDSCEVLNVSAPQHMLTNQLAAWILLPSRVEKTFVNVKSEVLRKGNRFQKH